MPVELSHAQAEVNEVITKHMDWISAAFFTETALRRNKYLISEHASVR